MTPIYETRTHLKLRGWPERLALIGVAVGIFALCQPFTMVLYSNAFKVLLYSILVYISVSHIKD